MNGVYEPKSTDRPNLVDATFTFDGPETPLPTVSAENLAREYETDLAAAEKKYKGNDIIVTGVIADIKGNNTARLKGTATIFVGVQLGADAKKAQELKVGQQVELRGAVFMLFKDRNTIDLTNGYVLLAK